MFFAVFCYTTVFSFFHDMRTLLVFLLLFSFVAIYKTDCFESMIQKRSQSIHIAVGRRFSFSRICDDRGFPTFLGWRVDTVSSVFHWNQQHFHQWNVELLLSHIRSAQPRVPWLHRWRVSIWGYSQLFKLFPVARRMRSDKTASVAATDSFLSTIRCSIR